MIITNTSFIFAVWMSRFATNVTLQLLCIATHDPGWNFVRAGGMLYLSSWNSGFLIIDATCPIWIVQSGFRFGGSNVHSRSKMHANPSNNSMNPIEAAARRNLFTSYVIKKNYFTKILSCKQHLILLILLFHTITYSFNLPCKSFVSCRVIFSHVLIFFEYRIATQLGESMKEHFVYNFSFQLVWLGNWLENF